MIEKIFRVFKNSHVTERWEVKAQTKDEAIQKIQNSNEEPDDREYDDVEWDAETNEQEA